LSRHRESDMYCGLQVSLLMNHRLNCLAKSLVSNVTEVVQTFPTYIKTAARKFLGLGAAGIVVAEQLPTNVWESGNYMYRSPIFAYYNQ
jgi:hypothetical protein